MTDTMLPILRQMHDAADDRVRADILLRVPDTILLKFAPVFEKCCQRAGFEAGASFIVLRLVALQAVRDTGGHLPAQTAAHLASYQAALSVIADGEAAP